jgi:hypothetical protein
MILSLPALAIGAHLAFTVADNVPRVDVTPSCRSSVSGIPGINQDFDACMKDENTARDELVKQWSTFAPADRTRCVDLSRSGTSATYTEMLTCMEMMRDAKQAPSDNVGMPSSTTGQRAR